LQQTKEEGARATRSGEKRTSNKRGRKAHAQQARKEGARVRERGKMLKWLATSMREDDKDLALRITDDPLATISLKARKSSEIYSINRLETTAALTSVQSVQTVRTNCKMHMEHKSNVKDVT
jgi:hypothetical protein